MSKAGKKRNAERKARRRAQEVEERALGQVLTRPVELDDLAEVLEDPFRLFALDPNDRPKPFFEAFPGALGQSMLAALHNGFGQLITLTERSVFRRVTDEHGLVWIESGEGLNFPIVAAEQLSDAQRKALRRRGGQAEVEFMSGEG